MRLKQSGNNYRYLAGVAAFLPGSIYRRRHIVISLAVLHTAVAIVQNAVGTGVHSCVSGSARRAAVDVISSCGRARIPGKHYGVLSLRHAIPRNRYSCGRPIGVADNGKRT